MVTFGLAMREANIVDCLKAAAILFVIFYHVGLQGFENGFWGVDIFLIVTGYLSAKSLTRVNSLNFILNRFYRIYPGLLLYLSVVFIITWKLGFYGELREVAKYQISSLLLMTNFMMLLSDGYFSQKSMLPLYHLWSISIEFQSWLIISLTFLFRNSKLILIFLSAISLFFFVHYFDSDNLDKSYLPTYGRFWEVGIGVFVFHYSKFKNKNWDQSTFGLLFTFLAVFIIVVPSELQNWIVVAFTSAALLSKNIKIGGVAGHIIYTLSAHTYGLYLWHVLVIFLMFETDFSPIMTQLLIVPISLVISFLLRRYVEKW